MEVTPGRDGRKPPVRKIRGDWIGGHGGIGMRLASVVIVGIHAAGLAEPAARAVAADLVAFLNQVTAIVAIAVEPGVKPWAHDYPAALMGMSTYR